MIQNTLFGHYYTAMHEFCQRYGYPIPSSEWQQIQSEFEETFPPVRKETETLGIVQKGKAVTAAFYSRPDSLQTTTIPARNRLQPTRSNGSATLPPPVPMSPPPLDFGSKPLRSVSNQSYTRPSPSPSINSYQSSDYLNSRPTGAGASRPQITSHLSAPHNVLARAASSSSIGSMASAAAKKKPPPPPPPQKKPSSLQQDYVVAQYDFNGQGEGDLPFREGDRIRVIKKTDSTNDWWEGECHGVKGSFPANYCKPV
jgi:amphiphysin